MRLVPPTFHTIWLGDKPMPAEYARFQRGWLDRHPGWTLRHWTEDNLPADLTRREIYETLRLPAERSDMLRLELLWRFGGVYLDTDLECLRPLDELIDGVECFVGDLHPGRVQNALIGSVAGHPMLAQAIRDIRPRRFSGLDKAATGPVFLNGIVRQFPGVRVFPPPVFYPSSPVEEETAYAKHWSARSWHDADQLAEDAARAEDRYRDAQQQLYAVRKALVDIRDAQSLDKARRGADRALRKLVLDASVASTSRLTRWRRRVKRWGLAGRVVRGAWRLARRATGRRP